MDFLLRPATDADMPTLGTYNRHLIEDQAYGPDLTPDELTDRMRGLVADFGYTATVVERDGALAGYVLWRAETHRVYVRQFFIARDHRRGGVGRAAFLRLREQEFGAREVMLDVVHGNESGLAFWRSVGFTDFAVTMSLGAR